MKNTILIFIIFLFYGCTAITQITEPDGSIYTIKSRTNAMVTVELQGKKIIVNNQGKPTLFEAIITMMFMDSNITKDLTGE